MATKTEHPVCFNDMMVQKILLGIKTMTRRPIRPQPNRVCDEGRPWWNIGGLDGCTKCPLGNVGDVVWVREAFCTEVPGCSNGLSYRADHRDTQGGGPANPMKWKPSIHMPRTASRVTLEVTGVKVERLHSINEQDAKAEGCDGNCPIGYIPAYQAGPLVYQYAQWWDDIYAKRYPWDQNPWVWSVSFKVLSIKG